MTSFEGGKHHFYRLVLASKLKFKCPCRMLETYTQVAVDFILKDSIRLQRHFSLASGSFYVFSCKWQISQFNIYTTHSYENL